LRQPAETCRYEEPSDSRPGFVKVGEVGCRNTLFVIPVASIGFDCVCYALDIGSSDKLVHCTLGDCGMCAKKLNPRVCLHLICVRVDRIETGATYPTAEVWSC
jgi:hypothetical protein